MQSIKKLISEYLIDPASIVKNHIAEENAKRKAMHYNDPNNPKLYALFAVTDGRCYSDGAYVSMLLLERIAKILEDQERFLQYYNQCGAHQQKKALLQKAQEIFQDYPKLFSDLRDDYSLIIREQNKIDIEIQNFDKNLNELLENRAVAVHNQDIHISHIQDYNTNIIENAIRAGVDRNNVMNNVRNQILDFNKVVQTEVDYDAINKSCRQAIEESQYMQRAINTYNTFFEKNTMFCEHLGNEMEKHNLTPKFSSNSSDVSWKNSVRRSKSANPPKTLL